MINLNKKEVATFERDLYILPLLQRSEKTKTKLALALKTYWKDHEKWEKKKGKKTRGVLKQMDRVQKIKSILGES